MDSPVAPQGKYYTECEQYMCMLDGNPLHCVDSNRDLACLVPRHTSPSPLTPDPHPARGGGGRVGLSTSTEVLCTYMGNVNYLLNLSSDM